MKNANPCIQVTYSSCIPTTRQTPQALNPEPQGVGGGTACVCSGAGATELQSYRYIGMVPSTERLLPQLKGGPLNGPKLGPRGNERQTTPKYASCGHVQALKKAHDSACKVLLSQAKVMNPARAGWPLPGSWPVTNQARGTGLGSWLRAAVAAVIAFRCVLSLGLDGWYGHGSKLGGLHSLRRSP